MRPAEWSEAGSALAALATATRAAQANRRHVIRQVTVSYSAAQIGLLQVKRGATVILERYIHNSADVEIPDGLREADVGEAVSAELQAGAAGVTGKVELLGYTE